MNEEYQYPIFDGTTLDPQFAVALKIFLAQNVGVPKAKSGFVSVLAGATEQAVPHGLGYIPSIISINGYPTISGGTVGGVYTSQSKNADAINIYIQNDSPSNPITAYWAAL